MSPEKVVAIRFILISSENPDNIIDSVHLQADVDCLTAERVVYAYSQETKNLTKDITNNDDSTNTQRNHVRYELVKFDTCLTQDSVNYETVDSNTC